MTHQEIADIYGVTRQAVTKRFNLDMGEYKRGRLQDVTKALPWDLAAHPAKSKLKDQESFLGLRAFLRAKLGITLSDRSKQALRAFLNHIMSGEVLTLDDAQGARYVRRDVRDIPDLVIRWPEDVPRDDRMGLFRLSPAQQTSVAS
ncbi:hypothetical protein [Streptomyces sp. DG1A-41]|uniref:hypothetical protein n=1 Tax=Streptomyces sp. DG1A-41 TaxID=3125779 RepID=UPI0030D57E61